ncbi:MAG: biopolymer transporter ExbD [Rhodoferax sp.]|uniref:ExbD/TolR family protein n=1 Tax=Rhodoferax sp. TaxID=50421 RepID=UPI002626F4E8|nr:biopolymer transporter ExbD [Rhodoferax sp.]MDD5335668.1 biopolymer transporter ExbD [Rhodoferax sp.]
MAIDFDGALEPGEPEFSSGMNITPLIDVLLVLLVMLIITIPIQLHSVNMELPGGLQPPASSEPVVVRIEVTVQNQLLWNGEPLADSTQLNQRLQAAAQLPEQPEIHVRPHRNAKYDTVALVLSASQQLGLQKIGVVGLDEYAR